MRAASEHYYGKQSNFHAIDGGAEATTLADHSIDWITAGQAFHWFDHAAAKIEFSRILRPSGRIALFWNDRADNVSPFVDEYNAVVKGFDVEQGGTPRAKELLATDQQLEEFFAPDGYEEHELPNPVVYDWDSLQGRALSSSYVPLPGHERHGEMIAALRDVYDRHQVDGQVRMDYVTRVYVGRL
jgi:SAM-dependent methyltransferase